MKVRLRIFFIVAVMATMVALSNAVAGLRTDTWFSLVSLVMGLVIAGLLWVRYYRLRNKWEGLL